MFKYSSILNTGMGVITASIDDDVEERLREKIEREGNKKGAIGEALSEALRQWLEERESQKAKSDLFQMMEEGYDMGEIQYEHRSELHDRWEKKN